MVFTMENAGQEKDDSVTLLATPCESPDLKVKVTKREHSNSGGVFEIPVCLDDDKRKRPQQKRPRVYPGFQNSAGSSYQWSVRGPSVAQFVQGKRIVYPPLLQPFKSSTTQSKFKAMDYAPSPESLYAPDSGKSTFAASPNSLYMYDQERHDMQNTLSSGMFGLSCRTAEMISGNIEPEFDLNPQYENSDSLEGFILSNNLLASACDSSISSSCTGRSVKQSCNDMISYMQVNQQELKLGGPTLAELNMDPFLMEDIDTIISNDEGEQKPQLRVPVTHMVSESAKPAPAALTNTATCFPPSQTSPGNLQPAACLQSNLFTNRTSNVAVVPPISVPRIKCEPEDTLDYSSCKTHLQKVLSSTQPMEYAESKPNLHKMQPSSEPQKPAVSSLSTTSTTISPCSRQVMPVVGQSRALPLGQQVKSESVEEKWKEIEKFIHDKETTCSRKRKRHASGGSAIISDEEDFRPSQLRSYSDEDSDSDADSDFSDTPLEESLTELARKSKQYFWQYNVQAKGPKGTRLKLNVHDNDPHHPSNFKDPVFDATSTSLVGIRHGGKARKGDGNEVTPNPKKLFQIGQQLYKLNRQINGFQLTSDQPASVRNKSRKEKNKLASRACRLKKKAQHEANKVKLTGLDIEQGELLDVIHLIWPQLKKRAQQLMNGVMLSPGSSPVLTDQLNALITSLYKTVIAGNTTDYVNEVIAKVEDGDLTGGLVLKPKAEKRTCD